MDITSLMRQRLEELGIEQRELAVSAGVTESYISQLLAKKKMPPAPDRTDIYDKIANVLGIPSKELSRLAETQRREEFKRRVLDPPLPLFKEFRQLILRKCVPGKKQQVTSIFEREPFGEVERFVTQKLLDIAKRVAKEELRDENWIHRVADLSHRSYEETRVSILEFLDTDIFHVSVEDCIAFLNPLIQSWDIDVESFGMEIVLNRKLSRDQFKKLEFKEAEPEPSFEIEPALKKFLNDPTLSAGITEDETDFLKRLRINGKHPSVLYYYRELQNLRDPVNFLSVSIGHLEGKALPSEMRPRVGRNKTHTRHMRPAVTSRKG
jgi:transcriptional regulator with XRE-family HTH domain